MPELPEVETVARGLRAQILGLTIDQLEIRQKSPLKNTAEFFQKTLQNNQIIDIQRQGKYLFLKLADPSFLLVIHLRMTGQLFVVENNWLSDKHTHLEINFYKQQKKLIYRDIRKFGVWELICPEELLIYLKKRNLGKDALLISAQELTKSLSRFPQKKIKVALLDQRILAGIGNIYADEILHRTRLHPNNTVASLNEAKINQLHVIVKVVLQEAILKKGTSFSDYINSYGQKGQFQLSLQVYQKTGQPCCYCQQLIKKIRVAGRGTYYCPACQQEN